ncbi:EAL domain-containing protein [Thiocystis violascens]|uniref:cyclic-guanylate-specific phosphodiesterase n=1 Tax=Thiocystis violascens (strain ATCC 17096 / DSM 198 / 6111) TaxID=765911 RepID=I3Y9Y3_THIV6|nr:EAL domain-containing protein [Thiocystis violascens]AFL73801.1 PAS domain S-box/diguanylate cyclase (GGDEF) domain-containing protein [Thiocystis violascens DSM 198]
MSATLLIVDDMPENLSVLGELLRGAGYRVRAATSGPIALEYATQEPLPDLILLDVMMPDMDGYEVLTRLRADARTRELPVIFITALDSVEAEIAGLAHGAADYITKPIVAPIVLARVLTQLELKRTRDRLRDQNAFLETEVARRVDEARALQDRSERIQAHLRHQLELILGSAGEGIQGVDVNGVINFINPAAAAMLGYARDDLLGRNSHEIIHHSHADGHHHPETDCPLQTAIVAGMTLRDQADTFWRKDGAAVPVEYTCMPIREHGQLQGAVITWRDIGERKRYLEQLERKSNYDDLTGLPNRNLLTDRLAQAIEYSREDGSPLTVLTLNLDRFKGINESLGRGAGDQALQAMAQRLTRLMAPTATLARVEGDEFILLTQATEREAISQYAQPIFDALAQPMRVAGREVVLSASIGIAVFPKDGDTGEALLRNAASAMFKAKVEGGQGFRFYAPAMNARALERLDLEHGLRRAIEKGELILHYQPQLDLRSGQIIGAEALVRWRHPERGMISPGAFIPLAEESGLIVPLGEWVLREACRQNRAWQIAGLPPLTVAVNLSARQFAAGDLVALTAEVLTATGLAPEYLELELTESAVMADTEGFIETTRRLKALSVALSIDDFGTGFSSLSYLRRFEIDRLKIDQSFVRDMVHDPGSAAIAEAIIALAHSLNLAALAEGVETEAQLRFLRARDCDEMQGYYFSRPLPVAEFEALLRVPRRLEFPDDSPPPQRTLLLVDDDPRTLFVLRRLFDPEGYQILTASDALAGLELLAQYRVGVVIADAVMPQMDGAEFLGRVNVLHPSVIRIMLTVHNELEIVTSAVNRGEIFKFLTKPWKTAELREVVRAAFRLFESRAGHPSAAADERIELPRGMG